MADYSRFIVYFHPTGAGAALNVHSGRCVRAVANAAAGADYIAVASNVEDATDAYGVGELRVSAAPVVIPPTVSLITEAFYDAATGTMQINPLVAFTGRASVGLIHERYEELWLLLHRLGPHYPPEDVEAADRLLFAMHGGVYRVFKSNLAPLAKLFWLSRQALGPIDGTQASVSIPLAGAGNSLDLTIPIKLAEREDGNEWSVVLRRAANAGAQGLAFDAGTKTVTIDTIAETGSALSAQIAALDFVDVSAFGEQLTTWGAGNISITGADGALQEVPAMAGDDPVIYQFAGGVSLYDRNRPETIAPIVDEIAMAERVTTGAVVVASPGPNVGHFPSEMPPLGTRLTVTQMFTAALQTSASRKPDVGNLRGGDWIEEIMF